MSVAGERREGRISSDEPATKSESANVATCGDMAVEMPLRGTRTRDCMLTLAGMRGSQARSIGACPDILISFNPLHDALKPWRTLTPLLWGQGAHIGTRRHVTFVALSPSALNPYVAVHEIYYR